MISRAVGSYPAVREESRRNAAFFTSYLQFWKPCPGGPGTVICFNDGPFFRYNEYRASRVLNKYSLHADIQKNEWIDEKSERRFEWKG